MVWYIKKESEDNNSILIAYSYENNDSCDGLLSYNKHTDNIAIKKISDGSDEFSTKWLFSHIYNLLDDNKISENKLRIAIG